jgi:hypothetical protein
MVACICSVPELNVPEQLKSKPFSSGTENSHIFISHKYEFVLHKYSHIIISHKGTIKVKLLPYFTKEKLKSHNSHT